MHRFSFWLAIAVGAIFVMAVSLFTVDLINVRRFIPISDSYDWLAFAGSVVGGVVGGFITFGGVYLTLLQQRKADEERKALDLARHADLVDAEELRNRLSIMPILEFKISYDPMDFDNSAGQLAIDGGFREFEVDGATRNGPGCYEHLYDLVVSNVGLGHALIKKVRLEVTDNQFTPVNVFSYDFTNKLVKVSSERHLRHVLFVHRNSPRYSQNPTQQLYPIRVELVYSDLLGNEYAQSLSSCIARGFMQNEDPFTGGRPFSQLDSVDPSRFIGPHQPPSP